MLRVILKDGDTGEDALSPQVEIEWCAVLGTMIIPYPDVARFLRTLDVEGGVEITDLRTLPDEKVTPP